MAEVAESSTPPGIAALPPTTVRQIGSHQLLTDPSSVVKELIDNALDARAKSIFVDITTNTIDFIQVKDDGHGIPGEDRALACRRYCTSKIRDFHDLKEVGGKWLGFRGEALASIADMSGTVSIMTRVEGEPVAVKLTYQRNGELTSTERDSHPVGTTVKVTNLLESAKVRKELAIKSSTKCLVKIRRLMQAYALARPAIRFRLHILKTKNNKGDFVYAPKANANVKDAVLKIFGKECALQCDWTALEMNGFELHAFLPKPNAAGPRVANQGAFISVESRPVSATRGTLKKIATAVRDRLRKANTTLTNVKDPFFCLNVICPVDSYDPNIEPAKDDVIFIDESFILALVDRLLVSYYPENTVNPESVEDSEPEEVIAVQPIQKINLEEPPTPFYTPSLTLEDTPVQSYGLSSSTMNSQQPHWRSSMYGIDEEDLGCLQEDAPPEIEEEDGRRDVSISNPWTIARMNAPVKSKKPISNNQLPSPAKKMNALFDFHQGAPPASASSPVRKARPPIIGSGSTPTARLRRRRTTDGGPYRAKSSTFPLNFVPYGFEVQNLSLKLDTNVSSVVLQARKLDMSANTLEWGYDTADAYDVFATTISERKIMDWVVKVDDMLHATFKRVDGVEVRGSLHEGIQRFLDARRGDEDDRAVAIISAEVPALDESGTARDILSVHTLPTRGLPQSESHRAVQSEKACVNADPAFREECVTAGATAESDEFEEDFDVSQFVDLDSQVEKQGSPVRHVKPEDDFGDGIEDEMLMDL
ncbi:hypothetical protein SLS59_001490 [Nothophoma quercina]|uniref:DNA mismatch repair protein S5 domain-containing protein n=1 Tax=Nothophoma quercina TaxID=749835 RepID=A0ABR3RXN5_9PLEO